MNAEPEVNRPLIEKAAAKCAHCSAMVPLEALFCSSCGGPVKSCNRRAASAVSPAIVPRGASRVEATSHSGSEIPAKLLCQCGRALAHDARFCDQCGASRAGARYWVSWPADDEQVSRLPIGSTPVSIGSAAGNSIRFDGDDFVSRDHARLLLSDGLLFVEDQGSSNGTFLRIRRPIALEGGDEIVIGTVRLRIEDRKA